MESINENKINKTPQEEYIELLKRENELLKKQVEILTNNQETVRVAMGKFIAKANSVQEVAEKTFNENMVRLKIYELKLISYYNKLILKYPIEEDLSSVEEFIVELKKVVNSDFFERENVDLFTSASSSDIAMTADMLPPSESGFNFFEALHPDKDLEELCKELGLMTQE